MIQHTPIRRGLALVIDIQRLFAQGSDWQVPDLPSILPPCAKLIAHRPQDTAFARFITAPTPDQAQGMWRGYYNHWRSVAQDRLEPGMLDVLPDLRALAPDAPVLDKPGYSAFSSPEFLPLLAAHGIKTLVLCGIETDVCVLSTVMEAVDRGLRVIVASDAVTSGSRDGHKAALDILRTRFDLQVQIATTAEIIAAWTE